MAKAESLGIRRLESVHYYVHDLERSRRFYTEVMDFAELGGSSEELTKAGRQKSLAFLAGNCVVVCIEPRGEGGRAWRWLRKHPDGVGTLNFEVEDVERTFRLLEGRGGTPIDDVRRFKDEAGDEIAFFSITTPFGDTTFRFVERHGYRPLYPGFECPRDAAGRAEPPRLRGLRPHHLELPHPRPHRALARARDGVRALLGDPVPHDRRGPGSRARLRAPLARLPGPRLGREVREQRALAAQLPRLADQRLQRGAAGARRPAPRDHREGHHRLREGPARAGLEFMPTPGTYYDALPARLKKLGIGSIDEDLAVLRDLEILVDGDGPGKYLLQIFLKESSGLYHDPGAGPFFFEIIQRKGDEGFGAGNFRALFESIERAQQAPAG